MSFLEKFFGYFKDETGSLEYFSDGLGHGFMDIRHLIWIIIAILIPIILIKLSKKHKDKVMLFCKIVLIFMFVQRLTNQIIRTVLMIENPFWRAAIPMHLCTIMVYLLPIVVVFNLKKIKKPVYFLSLLGGIITIIDGDYFSSLFLPFGVFEGTFAHTVLATIPIVLMYNEKERFNKLKDVRDIIFAMGVLAGWATIFNVILLSIGHGPNYMFLVRNMLPIGGKYFVFLYLLVFLIIVIATYLLSNIKNFKHVKKEIKENKYKILSGSIITAVYTFIIITVTNIFNK